MKILYVTQLLPYPKDSGGKIKTFETINMLSEKNDLHIVSFVDSQEKLVNAKLLKKWSNSINTVVLPSTTQRIRFFYLKILLNLFNPTPFSIKRNYSKKMKKLIAELCKKEKFDAIHIDHLLMTQYLLRDFQGIKVYEEHNLYTEMFKRYFEFETDLRKKFFYFSEYIKFKFYESREFEKFDSVLAISDRDKKLIAKTTVKNITTLPVAYQIKSMFKMQKIPTVLFCGVLSWWPNADGFWWFYSVIYPIIRKSLANVKLMVVGHNPTEEIKNINDKSVIVTGSVKDTDEYYKRASAVIVPIRAGAGIRIKILDAMAHGLPVVSTPLGAEGLPVENNKNILLADNPEEFAEKVIEVIKNKKLALKLSKNGLEYIKKNNSEDKSAMILNKIYGN